MARRTRGSNRLVTTVAAIAMAGLTACSGGAGGGDGAGSSSAASVALHGDYLRADSSSGSIQEIDFIDAAHYAMVPVGCTAGGGCEEKGSYRYDGTTLSLEDEVSGAKTELPLDVLSTFTGAPTAVKGVAGLVSSTGSGSLVDNGSTALVSSTSAQLVTSPTACPSGQTCAGSVQAGDNTLVAMGSPGAQGGAASGGSTNNGDDGDDSSGSSGGGSGGGGRTTYTGPCFPGSDDICTQ